MKKYIALLLGALGLPAHALTVDTMMLVSGRQEGDAYTLKNDSKEPVFVKTEIAKVRLVNNKGVEDEQNRANITQWQVVADPALFILDPGESRKVMVKQLNPNRELLQDEIYAISFVPQAQNNMSNLASSSMSLQIGFKTHFILPAKQTKLTYQLAYEPSSGTLDMSNQGNGLIMVELEQCKKGVLPPEDKPCRASFMLVPGKRQVVELPEWMRKEKMTFDILNYDRTLKEQRSF